MHEWKVFSDISEASIALADYLAEQIELAISQRGICNVLLPGGNTPVVCLRKLSEKNIAWEKVHWYLGDERCVPKSHASRNDLMLEINFWSHIPNANKYPIPAELGPEQAAVKYSEMIASINHFDIAFLGLGEDGHTASLFPDNVALNDKHRVVPVFNSPKPPGERVSVSVDTLRDTRCRVILTAGSAKADVLSEIRKGEDLPVNNIGDVHWFVDVAAMPINTIESSTNT